MICAIFSSPLGSSDLGADTVLKIKEVLSASCDPT